MSMLDAQRRVSKTAFYSTDRLAERIRYNGKDIVAIVLIGADAQRTDWGDTATNIENAVLADMATFCVCDDPDIGIDSSPVEGDIIEYDGVQYEVTQLALHDVAGCQYIVTASKNGLVMGRKGNLK